MQDATRTMLKLSKNEFGGLLDNDIKLVQSYQGIAITESSSLIVSVNPYPASCNIVPFEFFWQQIFCCMQLHLVRKVVHDCGVIFVKL